MAMRFEHEFTVPVPIEQAWSVLLDAERVAPCLPGASLDAVEGETVKGRMRVKVGPITVTYQGTATFENVDKDAHALTLRASGKEARGSGTASATVTARMVPEGDHTKVTVETSFNVTGRPAQFGRGVMAEVGSKLIDRFAANLAALLEEGPAHEQALPSPAETAFEIADEIVAEVAAEITAAAETHAAAAAKEAPGVEAAAPESVQEETQRRHLSAVTSDTQPAGTARTSRTPDEEALDLLEIAGTPVLKRVLPIVGGLAVLILAIIVIRRVFSN